MRHWFILCLCVTLLAGCAFQNSYREQDLEIEKAGPVAVIPFENLSGHPNAGGIVAEFFLAQLYASKRMQIVPGETVTRKLATIKDKDIPPEALGKLLGARSLVIGRVAEYTYKRDLGEAPAVGVSIKLVDAQTGRVLWSGARSQTGRFSWAKEDCLSRLTQEVCENLARSLVERYWHEPFVDSDE